MIMLPKKKTKIIDPEPIRTVVEEYMYLEEDYKYPELIKKGTRALKHGLAGLEDTFKEVLDVLPQFVQMLKEKNAEDLVTIFNEHGKYGIDIDNLEDFADFAGLIANITKDEQLRKCANALFNLYEAAEDRRVTKGHIEKVITECSRVDVPRIENILKTKFDEYKTYVKKIREEIFGSKK